MTYEKYVIEIFADDQDCMGMDSDEIQDIIEETPFSQIEKYLTKKGYSLREMYNNDCK
jgi:predicted P-loop ATPase